MKTVTMARDFPHRVKRTVTVMYLGGETYLRVPEMAVREIVKANAGSIVTDEAPDVRSER